QPKVEPASTSGEGEDMSAHEIQMNMLFQASLDKLIADCKQDKSLEKLCDKDFWMLRFDKDKLLVMQQPTTFTQWVKEYQFSAAAKKEAEKLLKVAIVLATGKYAQLTFKLAEQQLSVLPSQAGSPKNRGSVNIRCDFTEGKPGNYLNNQANWVF